MKTIRLSAIAAPATLALALAASPLWAQSTSTGTSSGVTGDNVSAGTYGTGTSTPTSAGVTGGGNATANGGTASTNSTAKANERQAMQRSVANAAAEDERARSRTHTHVLPNGKVKSQSMSILHEKGEKPVIDKQRSTATPDGTTTNAAGTP